MGKWKPKEGEKYWYIAITFHNEILRGEFLGFFAEVDYAYWDNDKCDKDIFKLGNCFRTKKEAQEMLSKIKKLLKK